MAESVWDILVGLKDLVVMAWDVLKSLLAGDLQTDAQGLWDDLRSLDWGKPVQGWRGQVEPARSAHQVALPRLGVRLFDRRSLDDGVQRRRDLGDQVGGQVGQGGQAHPRPVRRGSASKTVKAAKAFVGGLLDAPRSIWNKGPDEIAEAFRKAGFLTAPAIVALARRCAASCVRAPAFALPDEDTRRAIVDGGA